MSLIILLSDLLKKMIIDTEYNMLACFDINLQLKKNNSLPPMIIQVTILMVSNGALEIIYRVYCGVCRI